MIDITPFICYFRDAVYLKMDAEKELSVSTDHFIQVLKDGRITKKERDLWNYVLFRVLQQSILHKAVGKGLRQRRIRNNTKLRLKVH